MLFYRRSALRYSNESKESWGKKHLEKIPKWLIDEIYKENELLERKRLEFDSSLNNIPIEVYLDTDFYLEKNVLNLHEHLERQSMKIYVEKKNTKVKDLNEILIKRCTDESTEVIERKEKLLKVLVEPHHFLLVCRVDTSTSGRFSYFVKSKLHEPNAILYESIAKTKSKECVLVLAKRFDMWPVGDDFEPVRVVFKFYNKRFEVRDISCTFTKSTTVKFLKDEISNIIMSEKLNDKFGRNMII